MLSLDQFLRLVSLPAVVAAFVIASHVSATVTAPPEAAHIAAK
jgi:hypothetical protein